MIDYPPDLPKPSWHDVLRRSRDLCGGGPLHRHVAIVLVVEVYSDLIPRQVCEQIASQCGRDTTAKHLSDMYYDQRQRGIVRLAAMHIMSQIVREHRGSPRH